MGRYEQYEGDVGPSLRDTKFTSQARPFQPLIVLGVVAVPWIWEMLVRTSNGC